MTLAQLPIDFESSPFYALYSLEGVLRIMCRCGESAKHQQRAPDAVVDGGIVEGSCDRLPPAAAIAPYLLQVLLPFLPLPDDAKRVRKRVSCCFYLRLEK